MRYGETTQEVRDHLSRLHSQVLAAFARQVAQLAPNPRVSLNFPAWRVRGPRSEPMVVDSMENNYLVEWEGRTFKVGLRTWGDLDGVMTHPSDPPVEPILARYAREWQFIRLSRVYEEPVFPVLPDVDANAREIVAGGFRVELRFIGDAVVTIAHDDPEHPFDDYGFEIVMVGP